MQKYFAHVKTVFHWNMFDSLVAMNLVGLSDATLMMSHTIGRTSQFHLSVVFDRDKT